MLNGSQRPMGVTQQKQRIRHKSLAFTDTTHEEDTSDATEDSDKEIVMALPVRTNRSKSTLDKLVREPELGRYNQWEEQLGHFILDS